MFSHSGAYNGSAAVVIDEQPVTPVLAISTHPQLARDDSIGWLGGRPYYWTGQSLLSPIALFLAGLGTCSISKLESEAKPNL